jgi:prepilin-type N-terminal cleavage/methylation domain-containing protein
MTPPKRAFTLMELLVVIAILGILISITIPAFSAARAIAQRAGCKATLKSAGSALAIYLTEHRDRYPYITNRPSLGLNDLPNLPEALGRYLASDVLRCPADPGLYEIEGTSYEYNTILSGVRLEDAMFGEYLGPLYMPVLWDYEWFHGPEGENLAMNYLYANGTVIGLGENE